MFSSSKNSTNDSPQSSVLDNLEKGSYKLPSLVMTPIFVKNSAWPSYLIKPVYDEVDVNKPIDNHYYDVVNNLANNITSYGHTTHVTQNGTQMFPVMPYYVQSTKVGETIPQVMYPPTSTFYDNNNPTIPIVPTSTPFCNK